MSGIINFEQQNLDKLIVVLEKRNESKFPYTQMMKIFFKNCVFKQFFKFLKS
jgi:hypothetical protein